MAKLRVPSLQHLARNWHDDPLRVKRTLVNLAENSPNFNYEPLFGAVRDMLLFNHPYEQLVEGIRRATGRPAVLDNYLGVLPLIRDHFAGVFPAFVQSVDRRYYPVSQGLLVPFQPPLIYGVGGQIYFPWFSFWRANPIRRERLSLFVTMVQDVLHEDPDLEESKFQILDFSAPAPKDPRELTVIDAQDVPRISARQKAEMLAVFANGFFMAQEELARAPEATSKRKPGDDPGKSDQDDLFDPDHR